MNNQVTIKADIQYKGRWIKIFIPANQQARSSAVVSSANGEMLRTVTLDEGNNAIDISGIAGSSVTVKVETLYETILKNIQLNNL